MPYIPVTGGELYFTLATPGGKIETVDEAYDTIIFVPLHGTGLPEVFYRNQLNDPRLREKFNLVTFDLPGFQRSKSDDPPTSARSREMRDMAKQLQEATAKLTSKAVHVFSWAFGGCLCELWASQNPGQIKSLFLGGVPAPSMEPEEKDQYNETIDFMAEDEEGIEAAERVALAILPIAFTKRGQFADLDEEDEFLDAFRQMMIEDPAPVARRNREFLRSVTVDRWGLPLEQRECIKCPAFFVYGEHDLMNPGGTVLDLLVKDLPNAKSETHLMPGPHFVGLYRKSAHELNTIAFDFFTRAS